MSTFVENYNTKIFFNFINHITLPEIKLVEEELEKCTVDLSNPMRDMCLDIINSGGKRLRPLLLLYCAKCFGTVNRQVIKAAAAAELIHLASLVHDDIIDSSAFRHNRTTLNAKHGNHIPVLIGDFLFAKAFEILCSGKIYPGMKCMVEAIQHMCEGEILQAQDIKNPSFSLKEYYIRIEKKTAKLIAACCKTGACMSASNNAIINSMEEYGLNLGYAFQIIDDILDLTGSTENLGKPVFSDLLQGNITLPILILIQYEDYSPYIYKVIKEKTLSLETQVFIKTGLYETGALNQAYTKAVEYCEKAKTCLEDIPDSEYRQFLTELLNISLSRCS